MKYERSAPCHFLENVAIKMMYGKIHTFIFWEYYTIFSVLLCFKSITSGLQTSTFGRKKFMKHIKVKILNAC